jgi:hypothetical protein
MWPNPSMRGSCARLAGALRRLVPLVLPRKGQFRVVFIILDGIVGSRSYRADRLERP